MNLNIRLVYSIILAKYDFLRPFFVTARLSLVKHDGKKTDTDRSGDRIGTKNLYTVTR